MHIRNSSQAQGEREMRGSGEANCQLDPVGPHGNSKSLNIVLSN